MRKETGTGVETEDAGDMANGVVLGNDAQTCVQALKQTEDLVFRLMEETERALGELAAARLKCKLSNSRVAGVHRELKELIKVMSVYK